MTETPGLCVDFAKRLGAFQLQVQFSVGHELLVLFGHSGSGKSLTLRALAGLLTPDSGRISIDGTLVFDADKRLNVPPLKRGVGLVVQDYALFPHMTVAQNIAYGLAGVANAEQRARVDALLERLGLTGLERRQPGQLSGGQAQRVAVARALAPQPRLLLLDEPFSALDSAIRITLRRDIGRLKHELGLTIVFVTHDLREAYNLADQVAVFDQGRVLQVGSRDEVFGRPAFARVAELTEVRNIWPGRITAVHDTVVTVETDRAVFTAAKPREPLAVGAAVDLCIRPERIILVRPERLREEPLHDTVLPAQLVEEVAHGAWYTLFFRMPGEPAARGYDVEVDLPAHPYEVLGVRGQRDWMLAFPDEALHVMPGAAA